MPDSILAVGLAISREAGAKAGSGCPPVSGICPGPQVHWVCLPGALSDKGLLDIKLVVPACSISSSQDFQEEKQFRDFSESMGSRDSKQE